MQWTESLCAGMSFYIYYLRVHPLIYLGRVSVFFVAPTSFFLYDTYNPGSRGCSWPSQMH